MPLDSADFVLIISLDAVVNDLGIVRYWMQLGGSVGIQAVDVCCRLARFRR